MEYASLQCPICLEILEDPVETDCGHAFCEECLLKSVQVTPICPTCRFRIAGVIPSFTLRHVVFEFKKKQLQRKLTEAGLPQDAVRSNAVQQALIQFYFKGTAAANAAVKREALSFTPRLYISTLETFLSLKTPSNATAEFPSYDEKTAPANEDSGNPAEALTLPPMPPIITRRNSQPFVYMKKTVQLHFIPRHPLLFTGGGFDPGNLFLAEGIAEFCTLAEFNDFLTEANLIARKYTPSFLEIWVLGGLLCPVGGCCLLCWWADTAKEKLRDFISEQNAVSHAKGYMWALRCDDHSTCEIDEHFFLELTVDSRWRNNIYNTPKTREIHRLMADRTMLEESLRNRGVRLVRTISGHIQRLSPRLRRPSSSSSNQPGSSATQAGSPTSNFGGSPTEIPLVRGPSSTPPIREE